MKLSSTYPSLYLSNLGLHDTDKQRAGIPQIILPIWFDTYDFAHRIEYLGVGIWGNRQNAPTVHGDELGDALKRVLNSSHAQTIKQKARKIASQLGDKEGRVVACEKIMDLSYVPVSPVYSSSDGA